MKKITFITAMLLCLAMTSFSQNATKTADGNFLALSKPKSDSSTGTPTGKTFTDTKGTKYPVFESAKGKLYYKRTSKTGTEYKVYLKVA